MRGPGSQEWVRIRMAETACEIFHKPVSSPRFKPPGGALIEPESGITRTSHIGRDSGYGLTLGLSIALFAWLGLKLDEKLGTEPLFVLLGTFAGFGGAFYRMYHELVVVPRERDARGDDSSED